MKIILPYLYAASGLTIPMKAIVVGAFALVIDQSHAEPESCSYEWNNVPCMTWDLWDHTQASQGDYLLVDSMPTANYQRFDWQDMRTPRAMQIHIWNDGGWSQEQTDERLHLFAQSLAVMPTVLRQAMPYNTVLYIETNNCGPCYTLINEQQHLIKFPHNYVIWGSSSDRLGYTFEELFIHEVGHLLDHVGRQTTGTRISDSEAWQDAVDADDSHVSEYAESNHGEDFAESLLAWMSYHKARCPDSEHAVCERVQETMPNRRDFFDEALFRHAAGVSDFLAGN